MFKRFLPLLLPILTLLIWLSVNWCVLTLHRGVFPPPLSENLHPDGEAHWIDKSRYGIHQIILSGHPYGRGLAAGKLEKTLLDAQEHELIHSLSQILPEPWLIAPLELALSRWYWGIDKYFAPWMTDEMYGVAQSTNKDFDRYVESFTRQVVYHGLHEVGQLMVDQGTEDFGCTVLAVPTQHSWILGRNFDFEAGRIFDSEKIMKWVFPDQGYAYVSVIWAGMVGAVTGVNEHGLYISLNAAGSQDFRRYGTPSTLVLLKALQFAKNADEAIAIFQNEVMFITDIFVLLDSRHGRLYRIEKSPLQTAVIALDTPAVVTNHLLSPVWAKDPINLFRKNELSSGPRAERGAALLATLSDPLAASSSAAPSSRELEQKILSFIRDKGESKSKALGLGNRRAIDALIATHAVVFNGVEQILFVSQGPSLAGAFTGFDLAASFARHEPVVTRALARDPLVSEQIYQDFQSATKDISAAAKLLRHGDCEAADALLKRASLHQRQNYHYYAELGFLRKCKGDLVAARLAWQQALELTPAYPKEVRTLQEALKQ